MHLTEHSFLLAYEHHCSVGVGLCLGVCRYVLMHMFPKNLEEVKGSESPAELVFNRIEPLKAAEPLHTTALH